MKCNDCVYFKRCVVLGVELDMHHNKEADKKCRHFKNKTDFAEVVRCKDCKHWNNRKQKYDSLIGIKNVNGIGECRCSQWDVSEYFWCTTDENDFCSYGERKNTEVLKEDK